MVGKDPRKRCALERARFGAARDFQSGGIELVSRCDAKWPTKASVRRAQALLWLALLLAPSYAAAADTDDVESLRRMLRELRDQNRELSRRLDALEKATAPRQAAPTKAQTSPKDEQMAPRPVVAVESARGPAPTVSSWVTTTSAELEGGFTQAELTQVAYESATRQIIQDSLSKMGPKINSFLSLSGVVEVAAWQTREFDPLITPQHPFGRVGPAKDHLELGTVELDFDIKASEWLTGAVVVTWESGSPAQSQIGGPLFPTTLGTGAAIDRFTLDRAHILVGDLMQFPLAARFGREVLHFGSSTGVARLDTLSIGTPLTTAVFENRQTFAGFEFAFPTPPPLPAPAPVVEPPVQPLVLAPLVKDIAQRLGYVPLPQRVKPLTPVTPPLDLPPIYGSLMFYKGSEDFGIGRTRLEDFNASIGFRRRGHCGLLYEDLWSSRVCPWTLDFHVDYASNVFESIFLHDSYLPFLTQIGSIPGIAATLKASFGPFAFVGEVNKALEDATFIDGLGIARNITPMTWQAAIAYQFDWNPWVREIGAQGDFISVAYSGSQDMAGAAVLLNGEATRVGFVPETRLLVTAGEWVLPELKVAVEYSANWDYPQSRGGTGQLVHGIFGLVQFNF
jgi:hypothetical protein